MRSWGSPCNSWDFLVRLRRGRGGIVGFSFDQRIRRIVPAKNVNHATEDKIDNENSPWLDFPDVKNDDVEVPLGT